MAIIDVVRLRYHLLSRAKTDEEHNEIELALAGLSGDLDLLTSTEVAQQLGLTHNTVRGRAIKLRKCGYQLGIPTRSMWLYRPVEIELIRRYKELVGAHTKTAS